MSVRTLGIATLLSLFAVLGSCNYMIHHGTKETISVVVTDKERVNSGTGSAATSKYMIFTEDETFENVDSWMAWKFRSADLYGKIKAGQVCVMEVNGYRIPFLSMFRNVLSARCEG